MPSLQLKGHSSDHSGGVMGGVMDKDARRSRRRKQEHLSTLETEVSAKLFRFPHIFADVLCFVHIPCCLCMLVDNIFCPVSLHRLRGFAMVVRHKSALK